MTFSKCSAKGSAEKYMKQFLDLPQFFKAIGNVRNGEIHKMCTEVVRNYERDWDLTMDNNTYLDIRRFKNLLTVMKVKNDVPKIDKYERKRKFFAQMFSGVAKANVAIDKTTEALEKVTTLVDKFNEIVDTSSADIKKICNNLTNFSNIFVPENSVISTLMVYFVKFASLGYLLLQEQNRSVTNVIALLTLILPTSVGSCLVDSLTRAIQGIWDRFAKSKEFIAQGNDDSIITSFFKVSVEMIAAMFKNVPIDHLRNMQLSVSKIKMVADYLRNSTTIFEYIIKLFEKCMLMIGDKLFKLYGYFPNFMKEDSISDIVDRFVKVKEDRLDISAKTNSHSARIIVALYKDALHAQAKLVKSSKKSDFGQSKILAYLSIIVKSLETVIAKVPDHVKGTKNARRTKPFWIYIFGDPRIGKTSMLQPYIINLLAKECNLIESYEDYSNYTYFRNCGQEYWEKYCGQPVLWYNDLFQVFSDEQRVNDGIEELTNVVDDNLYPLNMAFEEKHSVYFDSRLVISNAQDDIVDKTFITNKCLSGGKHVFNRRNLSIRLRLNSNYKNVIGGINYDAFDLARDAGVEMIGDMFPVDAYYIDFMDVNGGMLLKTMYFKDAMNVIVNTFKNYEKQQNVFKGKLFQHFENMWVSQANEDIRDDDKAYERSTMRSVFSSMWKQTEPDTRKWDDVIQDVTRREWTCGLCKQVYAESAMLPENEQEEIRMILQLNCPHIIAEKQTKWRDFGDMIKINIKAFREKIVEFLKSPIGCAISILTAVVPILVFALYNYMKPTPMCANSAEGNIVRQKQQIKRNWVAQEYNQQNRDVEMKISKNMANFVLARKIEDKYHDISTFGSMLGIGGDIFALPKHFTTRLRELNEIYGDNSMYIKISFSKTQEYYVCYDDIKIIDLQYSHLADIAFIQCKNICALPKLDRFFIKSTDESNLYGSYLFGKRLDHNLHTLSATNVRMAAREYKQDKMEVPWLGKFLPLHKIVIPMGYEFITSGVAVGDCGMVLMNVDEKMNARKIMGIHVAGTLDGTCGLACPIYQDDILEVYKQCGRFIAMNNIEFVDIEASTSILRPHIEEMFPVLGTVPLYGGKKVKLTMPCKTKISKSVVFDIMEKDFGPHNFEPAQLRPFRIGDSVVSPMLLGLSKMTNVTKPIRPEIRKIICDHMYTSVMDWNSPYIHNPRLLTDDEMVNGINNLNKIDITTSAGFPYQLNAPSGGKRDWLFVEDGKMFMTSAMMEKVKMREEFAQKGLILDTFFVDTLKDETRPIEKVRMGKTRVFQVGPMCLSLLMRKYFGWFLMHCQSTFVDGEMSVGINPNSSDWTRLIRRLMRVGTKFINGDYSNYDAVMSQQIMMDVVDVINRFYGTDDETEDAFVRKVLFATFLNNIHIIEDLMFIRLQGNMSGVAVTTNVNCMFNMFLLRYAYYMLVDKNFDRFHDLVQAAFYGDDNLVCIADSIADKLNMQTYCDIMKTLGIVYTTPDKGDMNVILYDLDNIVYLKRRFVERDGVVYAQLDEQVMQEIPRWSESDPTNALDQLNRFNSVLYEAVNYGYSKYAFYYKYFSEYVILMRQMGYVISLNGLLTYGFILRSMFPEYFPCDLSQCYDQGVAMLRKTGRCVTENDRSNQLPNSSDATPYLSTMNTMSNEGNIQRATQQISRVKVAQNYEEYRDKMDDIDNAINFKMDFEHKLFAMSSQVLETIDENAGETVTTAQITTSFDDTIPHKTDDGQIVQPIYHDPYLNLSLESFVQREWYIGTVPWDSVYDRTQIKKLFEFPNAAMTYLVCKLENIAYWAPDLRLIFKVNGTPMHYGRFMFAVIPSADILHDTYKKPQNLSQNRFVQISPTGNQTVVLEVPWIHYYDRVPVSNSVSSTVPWTLYGWPAVPLSNAVMTKTPSPVTISIYVVVTNPRFTGYSNTDVITRSEMIAQSNEQVTLSKQENVTSGLRETGLIDFTNTIARDITNIAGDMSQLAVDVGFSNAANLTATKPFVFRNTNLNRAEDLPLNVVLGPSQNQSVIVNNKYSNAVPNAMHISKVAGRMCLINTIEIGYGTKVNDNVVNIALNPLNLNVTDFNLESVENTLFPHPAAFLARLAKFWRGSFKFHFSFVCSAFHSMRLRLNYAPFMRTTPAPPNAGTSSYNVNQVWDINNQTDYSVRIPFFHWKEWCNIGGDKGADIGNLYLTALTTLSSSSDTPTPMYLQVWAGMDDDFQLAYPFIPAIGTTLYGGVKMYNPDIGSWVTREANETIMEAEMVAQSNEKNILTSGNPLLNYKSMQFPAMSSDGLEKLVYPSIGGKEKKHKNCRVNMSYELASVKEMCNMLTPVERSIVYTTGDPVTSASFANAGRIFTPFAWMDRGANDSIWYNFMYQIMALFRYARGSVRLAVLSDRAQAITANLGDLRNTWNGSIFETYTNDVFFDSGPLSDITTGSHLFVGPYQQPADVVIPYYSEAKCLPQTYNVKTGTPTPSYPAIMYAPSYTDASMILRFPVPANTAKGAEIGKIVWLVAGGDDFQLGYQLPVPRCRFAAASI